MFEDKIKKLDLWDLKLSKLGAMAFVLFIITIWPAAMTWVQSVNPWYFLIASIICAIRPIMRMFWCKK